MINTFCEVKKKMHQRFSIAEWIQQRKQSLSLNTDYLKIHSDRRKKNEECLHNIRILQENYLKRVNLRNIGVKKGVEKQQEVEKLFKEITTENFPKLDKNTNIQVQESQRSSNRFNPNKVIQRHIIIKQSKSRTKRGS